MGNSFFIINEISLLKLVKMIKRTKSLKLDLSHYSKDSDDDSLNYI